MKRVFWLDAARAIAIILVVFTHAHERVAIQSDMLRSVFYSIDRLGVPVFFMISGGLILPKLVNCGLLSFYKKRIPQFIILAIFWCVVTNFIKYYIDGVGFVDSLKMALINNNGFYPSNFGGASHIWFMYTMIQLYIIAPFLAKILNNSSNKDVIAFLFVCVIFNQFKYTVSFLLGGDWGTLYRMGDDLTGSYLIFFVLGYLIIERSVWYGKTIRYFTAYALIAFIPVILLVLTDRWSGKFNDEMHWYGGSLFIVISSIGLLLLLKLLFEDTSSRILSFISKCSFGIYLSHYSFIYMAQGIMKEHLPGLSDIELMIVYFVISFLAGVLLTSVMMRTKLTKYLVA